MRWSASLVLLLVLVLVLVLCTLRCHSQNYNIIYNEAELVPPGRSRAPHCTATFWGIIHDVFVVKQLHQQCFNKIPKASAQQDWQCSLDADAAPQQRKTFVFFRKTDRKRNESKCVGLSNNN